jgi:hypothetical protein
MRYLQADELGGVFPSFDFLDYDKAPLWQYRRVLAYLVGPAKGDIHWFEKITRSEVSLRRPAGLCRS